MSDRPLARSVNDQGTPYTVCGLRGPDAQEERFATYSDWDAAMEAAEELVSRGWWSACVRNRRDESCGLAGADHDYRRRLMPASGMEEFVRRLMEGQ